MKKTYYFLFAAVFFLSAACDRGDESGFFTVTVSNASDYEVTDITISHDGAAGRSFPFLAELKKGENHPFNCETTPKNTIYGVRVWADYTINGSQFGEKDAVGAINRDGVYWVPKYALDGSKVYITITNENWEMDIEGGTTD